MREAKTILRNPHDFPIQAVVTDQIPYSENSAIAVEILGPTTPPDEQATGEKQGLLRWRSYLALSETKNLFLSYRLKWPADREVTVRQSRAAFG